jgi:hypothetical protein
MHQSDELALSRLDTNTGKTDHLHCMAKQAAAGTPATTCRSAGPIHPRVATPGV